MMARRRKTPADRPPAAKPEDKPGWWGEYSLAGNQTAALAIGPLDLALHHGDQEWLIAQASNLDPFSERLEISIPGEPPQCLFGAERHRYSYAADDPVFVLTPQTADRPCVIRPESPVSVPPGESATFYVTTPLWIAIAVGKRAVLLQDIPTLPMNDTWFGTTLVGELCYAGWTWAKNRADSVPPRPHRIVTPVHIHNRAPDLLHVESLKLPLPNLPVMVDELGRLHTPALQLTRQDADDKAVLRMVRDQEYPGSRLVSPAREVMGSSSAFQVFSRIFD